MYRLLHLVNNDIHILKNTKNRNKAKLKFQEIGWTRNKTPIKTFLLCVLGNKALQRAVSEYNWINTGRLNTLGVEN